MIYLKRVLLFSLLTLVACNDASTSDPTISHPQLTADTVLTNANIYSFDWPEPGLNGKPNIAAPFNDNQWHADAQAIAVREGKILFVGDNESALKFADENSKVLDLAGATVIPGLVDSHVHIAELGEILHRVNLTDVLSPDAAIEEIQKYLAANPQSDDAESWIIGQGWDEGAWANNYPNRQLLDQAFPDRPVYLRSLHGFAVWVNSKALELAGIDEESQAPVGGEIVRDESGQPTGILLNRATTLMANRVPKPSLEKFANYIKSGLQQMSRDGFVAVHEAGAEAMHIEALQLLRSKSELPIRMYAMLSARDAELAAKWSSTGPLIDPQGFLDIRSVKAYYDGALGSRGARLLEDYSDQAGHRGVSGEGYGFDAEIVDKLIAKGFQVGIHAIGDAGNREVLDYFSGVAERMPDSLQLRHRIEHAQVIEESDFERVKQLKLIASMEPPHAVEDKTWAEDRLGADRIKGAYAWRTIRQMDIPLTFNSDLPGSDHNIFYGLHAAVTRRDKKSEPSGGWYPEQNLTIEEAIRAYTSWAAYSAFRETQTGVLKEGFWADISILDIDPLVLSIDNPGKILQGKVLMTMVNGRIVFQDSAIR